MILAEDFHRKQLSADFWFFDLHFKSPYGPDFVHAFVEGEDDKPFYRGFLGDFVDKNDKMRIRPCYGKEGVYNTFRKIKRNYSPEMGITLYFVDKDHSDILKNEGWEDAPNIYVTDYYSIENYLVNEDMLARIWDELFNFKNGSLEFGHVHREKFIRELDSFYEFVRPIMAWAIFLRRQGRKPNMDEINFSRFFDFDDELVLRKTEEFMSLGEFGLVSKVCGEQVTDDQLAQIRRVEEEISAFIPKAYIRGKLELSFFVKFIEKLMELLNRHISKDGGKVSLRDSLGEKNAITILGPRVPIPLSLRQFLTTNLINSTMQDSQE